MVHSARAGTLGSRTLNGRSPAAGTERDAAPRQSQTTEAHKAEFVVCKSTIYRWFAAWRDAGLFAAINHALVMADRERAGRAASPTAAVMDSQSVKTAESGGPRGYDAGKRVRGRKRQALVDTDGRALLIRVHAADVQDRDGAVPLLRASRRLFPWIATVFADAGYAADRVAAATRIAVEIVRKHPGQVGFAVHPRRWVVERFFAWLGRNRGLAKDVEATIASATAFLYAAPVMLLLRRVEVSLPLPPTSVGHAHTTRKRHNRHNHPHRPRHHHHHHLP